RHHPLADELGEQQLDHFLADVRTLVGRAVNLLPPHHEFVARHCGMPAAAPAPAATPPASATAQAPSDVYYEIFVRSWYDSDGDGTGDLNGVTAKLDYLKSLGVDGIWLMPINPSPSYHGYDITDYEAIN